MVDSFPSEKLLREFFKYGYSKRSYQLFFADSFKPPQRSVDKPFRLCVADVFKGWLLF